MLAVREYAVVEAISYIYDTELGLLSGYTEYFYCLGFCYLNLIILDILKKHQVGGLSAILIFRFN